MRGLAAGWAVGALLLFCGVGAAQTYGGIQNGGFATGISLSPWTVSLGYAALSNASPHGGYWSLQMSGSSYGSSANQVVPVNAGTQYLVSAWVHFPAGIGMSARLTVDDSVNSSSAVTVTADPSNGAWQYVSVPYTSNLSGSVRVSLLANGNALVYWDDVSITPLAPVVNYGFESGAVQPWTSWVVTPYPSTSIFHTGSTSLAMPANPTTNGGSYQDITVTPGVQYFIGAWVMAPSGTGAELYLNDTQDAGTGVATFVSAADGVWQYLSLLFTADQTGRLRIHLIVGGSGTVYWDDVNVTAGLPVGNAGFESGNTQSWTASPGASPSAVNPVRHSGGWSLAVPATASPNDVSQVVNTPVQQPYTVSAWVLAPAGATASLVVEDTANGYSRTVNAPAPNGLWQYVSTVISPQGGNLRVHLSQSGSGTVYWDDVSVALASVAISRPAGYRYDYTASPVIPDGTRWSSNGSPTFTSSGVTFGSAAPGDSLISIPAISGANSSEYEVKTTLAIKSGGGTYIQFLRADSAGVRPGIGNYVSVELAIPASFSGSGLVTLNVNQCINGSVMAIGSASTWGTDGMTLRTVVLGNYVLVMTTQYVLPIWIGTVTPTTGNPGIGGYGIPAGSGFTAVSLGPRDTVPPGVVPVHSIISSVLPNQVSLKWQGVQDDPNGIGLMTYQVWRNGAWITNIPTPEFSDDTVAPGTTYSYMVVSLDFHSNFSFSTPFNVTTPPAQSIDPRRTGVLTTGSYWGGGGEQIDTLSGNLNFSLPLVTAQGRTGWKVPVGLSYNSQNWRQDNGANWQLGNDVGYGFGWRAQIGSITPYNVYWWMPVDHYIFTDGTGAEYRLDQNNGGVWSSTQGIYVWFDANTNILHFKDGTFWIMNCTSGGTEADAGTMYPTSVEDVSGNQVLITYQAGVGLPASATNTSARITSIQDVRGVYAPNFLFTWNSDSPVPHLTGISNTIGTSDQFYFTYAAGAALAPPFGADASFNGLTTAHLASVTVGTSRAGIYGIMSPYQFSYDAAGAGELTSVVFPYGGQLSWNYVNFQYVGSRTLREVGTRYLAADSAHASSPWVYAFSHPDGANSVTVHSATTLVDASGVGAKTWSFLPAGSGATAWKVGLISQFTQLSGLGGTVLRSDSYAWGQTPGSGNPYIAAKVSVSDPGTGNQQSAQTTQTLDQYGNTTQMAVYPYNSGTALRTYNSTYLNTGSYPSHYIFNRLVSTTLTTGGTTKTLVTNTYDTAGHQISAPYASWGWTDPSPAVTYEIDATPPVPLGQRGYLTISATLAKTTWNTLWTYGALKSSMGSDGSVVTASADAGTNYAAPQSVATQSYNETIGYSPWLGITQTTGANGEQLYLSYDLYARPATGTSPYGAVTYYSYSAANALPVWQSQAGADGITTTTLDGLGRAIRVARGDGSGVKSYTDTVYAPCACSPLGKVQKVSQSYPAGQSASAWTVYSYDGLGRTLSVTQPDGASTTHYAYSGNQTTVTVRRGSGRRLRTMWMGIW